MTLPDFSRQYAQISSEPPASRTGLKYFLPRLMEFAQRSCIPQ